SSSIFISFPLKNINKKLKYIIDIILKDLTINTDLFYEKLLVSKIFKEKINIKIECLENIPDLQNWILDFKMNDTTLFFISQHIDYISDLINDWVFSSPLDLSTFLPIKYQINLDLHDLEVKLVLLFDIPVQVKNIKIYIFIPLSNTLHSIYILINKNTSQLNYNNISEFNSFINKLSWIEIGCVEFAHINFVYSSPIKYCIHSKYIEILNDVKPSLINDTYKVTIKYQIIIGTTFFKLYGLLVDYFLNGLLGNYMGPNLYIIDTTLSHQEIKSYFDAIKNSYKFNENNSTIEFSLCVHDLYIILPLLENKQKSPICHCNNLFVEISKNEEISLQILLTPFLIIFPQLGEENENPNFLLIDGIILCIENMVNNEDNTSIPIEYAILRKILIGRVDSALTIANLGCLISWLDQFLLGCFTEENLIVDVEDTILCHHGLYQKSCQKHELKKSSNSDEKLCPTVDDLQFKYMFINIVEINFFILLEDNSAITIQLNYCEFSSCSKHNDEKHPGFTLYFDSFNARFLYPGIDYDFQWFELFRLDINNSLILSRNDFVSDNMNELQNIFLIKNDFRNKRLLFLSKRNIQQTNFNQNFKCSCCNLIHFRTNSDLNLCCFEILSKCLKNSLHQDIINGKKRIIFKQSTLLTFEINGFHKLIAKEILISETIEYIKANASKGNNFVNIDMSKLTEADLIFIVQQSESLKDPIVKIINDESI
ncbi:hypothetical protein HZS_270, partial [Henneguya salminicola]